MDEVSLDLSAVALAPAASDDAVAAAPQRASAGASH
jgi:hypothetical protein